MNPALMNPNALAAVASMLQSGQQVPQPQAAPPPMQRPMPQMPIPAMGAAANRARTAVKAKRGKNTSPTRGK